MDSNEQGARSLSQMTSMLSSNLGAVETAERELKSAEFAYQRATAGFATEAMREAALVEYVGPLEAAEDELSRKATVLENNARGMLASLEGTDRVNLSDNELATAAARSPLVREDVDGVPWSEIVTRLRGAITADDRITQYLLARHIRARIRAGEPERTATPGRTPLPESDREQTARGNIQQMLGQVDEALRSTEFDPARQRANDALVQASKARQRATARQRASQPILTMDGRVKIPFPERQGAA